MKFFPEKQWQQSGFAAYHVPVKHPCRYPVNFAGIVCLQGSDRKIYATQNFTPGS